MLRYILHHLQTVIDSVSNGPMLKTVAVDLRDEMNRRFAFVLNINDPKFDPLYVSATWLYSPTQYSISSAERELAKDSVFKLYKLWSSDPSAREADFVCQEASTVHNSNSPATSLSKSMEFFASIASPPFVPIVNTPKSAIEMELDSYATTGISFGPQTSAALPDAQELWNLKSVQDRYPLLSLLAQEIFAIPASSAPVERVFSTAGIAASGRSARLSGENLETKVLLQ